MHQISAPQLSTVDLIDELEARIAALRGRNGHAPVAPTPDLRAEMERADVSAAELARAMHVTPDDLHDWMAGRAGVPPWALAAIRLVALLPPSERRKLLTPPRGEVRGNRTHPFSRIEDL